MPHIQKGKSPVESTANNVNVTLKAESVDRRDNLTP